jgi:hypothetical protein
MGAQLFNKLAYAGRNQPPMTTLKRRLLITLPCVCLGLIAAVFLYIVVAYRARETFVRIVDAADGRPVTGLMDLTELGTFDFDPFIRLSWSPSEGSAIMVRWNVSTRFIVSAPGYQPTGVQINGFSPRVIVIALHRAP